MNLRQAIATEYRGEITSHTQDQTYWLFGPDVVVDCQVERAFSATFGEPCDACDELSDSLELGLCAECREHFENEDAMRDEELRQMNEAFEAEFGSDDDIEF